MIEIHPMVYPIFALIAGIFDSDFSNDSQLRRRNLLNHHWNFGNFRRKIRVGQACACPTVKTIFSSFCTFQGLEGARLKEARRHRTPRSRLDCRVEVELGFQFDWQRLDGQSTQQPLRRSVLS